MLDKIKELRQATGLGMMACKKALEETNGDVDKAIEILRKKGEIKAAQRSERTASEGYIGTYLHSNGKISAIVELNCETDFVARNENFIALAGDLAMHVAAMAPKYLNPEDANEADMAKEKEIYIEQLKNEGKPAEMIEKILEGKMKKFTEESAFSKQKFVKDEEYTIEKLIVEASNKMGENVKIGRFMRIEIGK